MFEFFAALAIFLVSHSIPARPAIRDKCVALLGERPYLLIYSTASLVLLAWLLSAASRAPYIALWNVSLGQYLVPIVSMIPALFLFAGGAICPNPLFVNFSKTPFDPARPASSRSPAIHCCGGSRAGCGPKSYPMATSSRGRCLGVGAAALSSRCR